MGEVGALALAGVLTPGNACAGRTADVLTAVPGTTGLAGACPTTVARRLFGWGHPSGAPFAGRVRGALPEPDPAGTPVDNGGALPARADRAAARAGEGVRTAELPIFEAAAI